MNLYECYEPILLNMLLDLLLSDNNSKYKNMTKLELIDYMRQNLKQFKIIDNLIYEIEGNVKSLVFQKDKLNNQAIEILQRLSPLKKLKE